MKDYILLLSKNRSELGQNSNSLTLVDNRWKSEEESTEIPNLQVIRLIHPQGTIIIINAYIPHKGSPERKTHKRRITNAIRNIRNTRQDLDMIIGMDYNEEILSENKWTIQDVTLNTTGNLNTHSPSGKPLNYIASNLEIHSINTIRTTSDHLSVMATIQMKNPIKNYTRLIPNRKPGKSIMAMLL